MKLLRALVNALALGLVGMGALLLLGLTAAPAALGYTSYVVLSGSMEPAIHTGAVVFAKPVPPSTLKLGDVIVYNRSDANERVTHRIVEVNNDASSGNPTFVTKGDANGSNDPWSVQYSGPAGKVVFNVPYVGYINNWLGSPQGRLAFVIVPVAVLAGMWLWQIWKPSTPGQPAPVPLEAKAPPAASEPAPVDLKSSAADKPAPLPLAPVGRPIVPAVDRELRPIGLEPLPAPAWALVLQRLALAIAALLVASITAMFVFLSILPRTGLYATYTVLTGSMAPAIPMGSVAIILPEDPSKVALGDVIVVTSDQPPHPTVTHRVTHIIPTPHGPEFKTKGDANLFEDPWQFSYSGPAGKVRLSIPLLGYVLAFAATQTARLALAGCAGLLLIGFFLPAIWRSTSGKRAAVQLEA